MKKLFTFAAAVLASVSLWASSETDLATISANHTVYFADIVSAKVNAGTLFDSDYLLSVNGNNYATNKGSDANGKLYCLRVKSTSQDVLAFKVDSKCTLVLYADNILERAPFINTSISATDANVGEATLVGTKDGYVTFAIPAAGTYYIIGNGKDLYLSCLDFSGFCTNPELTVSPTEGTGFVGDAIDIAVTSKNKSKPLDAAVTVDGVPGVYGTDYTFKASTGLVQATPLRAGTFVITFSQASNGTYCDAEESATFVISEKAAVTSFEIEGPTSARVGDEITLTATNFNAAATSIWWTDKYGTTLSSTAEYTFTPEAEGDVVLTAWAENEFNESSPVNLEHTVSVTIGHNAKLSSLKINGVDLEGFDGDVFNYDLGEIGVYEPVEVTAIPADDPYATAVVNPGLNNVLITVFAQDKTTYNEYTIKYTRKAATELASISGNTTWDWADAGSATAEFTNETLPTKSEEFNFADVLISPAESFNAAALAGIAQFANRGEYVQGTKVRFHTTVDGTIEVSYQNTSNRDESGRRWVVVNDQKVGDGAIDQKNWYVAEADVKAGDVVITFVDTNDARTMLRINKLVFTKDEGGETALDNIEAGQVVKTIIDGQLVIIKNGIRYNAQGAVVK
jgi:hypothetical protein